MTPATIDSKVLAERREHWAGFGAALYEAELQLQAISQKAIIDAKTPSTVADLPAARESLKQLKAAQDDVTARRKKLTDPIKSVAERLMQAEKSFEPKKAELEKAIIVVTKNYEEAQAKIKLADDERKSVKQKAIDASISANEKFKLKVANQVLYAYEYALTNKVEPAKIAEYVKKCSAKFKITDFAEDAPSHTPKNIDAEECHLIIAENFTIDAGSFIAEYVTALQIKFANYATDYANAEKALEDARQEQEEKNALIKSEASAEKVATQISTLSETLTVTEEVKGLKKQEKVSDSNAEDQLLLAFVKNIALLSQYVKNKAFYDTIKRAIEAARAKGEGKFENIVFETVEKVGR